MTRGQLINSAGVVVAVDVSDNFGEFAVSKSQFEESTGWSLKPEGLCRNEICVPVREAKNLTDGSQIDLVEFSRVLGVNILVDSQKNIAAFGEQADSRGAAMTTLTAPDFTLPDIHGRQVTFSDFNRRKRLLLAWSSW